MTMTVDELTQYYANLLILQYVNKPKAYATIQGSVQSVIMDQLPLAVQNAYGVDTAIGKQQDVLGKYVGVSRDGYTLSGPISLSDTDYRALMKLVILKNTAGSSLGEIQALLAANFPGQIFVSDNQTMGLNYVILESLGTSDLLQILVIGGYLPRPMGVQVSVIIVPVHAFPFFGFRTYSAPDPTVSPFNSYPFYQLTYPWFSYFL